MCFRFRMNYGPGGKDYASDVWNEGFVGIWHGQWDPEDLYKASDSCRPTKGYVTGKALAHALNELISSRGGPSDISDEGGRAALRFDEMEAGVWVFTFFDRTIHMAQIAGAELQVLPQFNHNGEVFKAKPIMTKKTFRLAELPPSFLLLPSAGRGSVHEVPSCSVVLKLLIDHESASEVTAAFDALPWTCGLQHWGQKDGSPFVLAT